MTELSAIHSNELKGLSVVLTRPETSSTALSSALKNLGADVRHLPTLEIIPLAESAEIRDNIMNIDRYDTVIFISPTAANLGAELIDKYWPQLPTQIQWLAVGKKTAETLKHWDIMAIAPDQTEDSEGLLSLPGLQKDAHLNGVAKKVLIIRGTGGREHLAQTLADRGMQVTYCELYERICPTPDIQHVKQAFDTDNPVIIVTYSGETLQNLLQICDNTGEMIRNKVILVPGKRVEALAAEYHFKTILIPTSLQEEAIIQCMTNWWQQQAEKQY